MPTIDFDVARETEIPVMLPPGVEVTPPKLNIDTSYNPFAKSDSSSSLSHSSPSYRSNAFVDDWNKMYEQLLSTTPNESNPQQSFFSEEEVAVEEIGSTHFQYKGQYIVSATNTGLMIVDQRRAHIRILYDKYIMQMARRECATQGLLFPELLTLSHSDAQIMEQILDDVRHLGFDIHSIGGGSFSVNGLPAGVEGLNPQVMLSDMVASVREGKTPDLSEVRHRIALSLSRVAAIVEGQVLSQEEMDVLMSDLFKSTNPNHSPDGKTIVAILKQDSINKMFL
jgi:DNA mismatch repair protein MutL